MLQGVRSTTLCTVARQKEPPQPLEFALLYQKTQRTEDFRLVYALLGRAGEADLPRFEDYYFTRRGLQSHKNGRTYYLCLEGETYFAAQAERFYQNLGFEPCGQFVYARFDPPDEVN